MGMNNDLKDLRIVVTGGTGALGSVVVQTLLERGAICHVPAFEAKVPESFEVAKHERVHVVAGVDLAEEDRVREFFGGIPELWASVHIAGGFSMAAIAETSAADFEAMWRRNTLSCFLSCREAAIAMRAGRRGGRIVNVAARPALEPVGGMVAYSCSKAGVVSITESLARELASEEILVNAIVPSIIDTPANRKSMPDADHESWPKPRDMAWVIANALSPQSRLCSGALLPLYGKQL